MGETWSVRRATTDDGPAIMAIAAAAWRDTYDGLLKPETIETFIERAYSSGTGRGEPVVERRWWRPAESSGLR